MYMIIDDEIFEKERLKHTYTRHSGETCARFENIKDAEKFAAAARLRGFNVLRTRSRVSPANTSVPFISGEYYVDYER